MKNSKNYLDLYKKAINQIEKLKKNFKKLKIKESEIKEINKMLHIFYDLMIRDPKTGLFNFNFFNELLNIEISKARRNKEKMSIILCDIDDFKKINDIYGYLVGDKIIIYLSKLLQKIVRKGDIIARFGGEEFIILLPSTDMDKAKRIKKAIDTDCFLSKYRLHVSIGIASFCDKDNKDNFFKKADKALKYAKKTGKNKIVIYEKVFKAR